MVWKEAVFSRANKVLVLILVISLIDILPYLADGGGDVEAPKELAEAQKGMTSMQMPQIKNTSQPLSLLSVAQTDTTAQAKGWDLSAQDVDLTKHVNKELGFAPIFDEVAALGYSEMQRSLLDQRSYYIFSNYSGDSAPGRWISPDEPGLSANERPAFNIQLNTNITQIDPYTQPTPVDIDGNGSADLTFNAQLVLTLDGASLLDSLIPIDLPGRGGDQNETRTGPGTPGTRSKPSLNIIYPLLDGRSVSTDITVRGEATDLDGGLEFVEFRLTSEEEAVPVLYASWSRAEMTSGPLGFAAEFQFDLEVSRLDNGEYTIEARAYSDGEYSSTARREIGVVNPFYDARIQLDVEGGQYRPGQQAEVFMVYPSQLKQVFSSIVDPGAGKQNTTNVVMIGLTFPQVPAKFQLCLDPNMIKLNTAFLDIASLLKAFQEGTTLSIRPLDGPFEVEWSMSEGLKDLKITLGLLEMGPDSVIVDGTCIEVALSDPAPAKGWMDLELDTEVDTAATQILREVTLLEYGFSSPCSLDIFYRDMDSDGDGSTTALAIAEAPAQLSVIAKNLTMLRNETSRYGGLVPYTQIEYRASGEFKGMSFEHGYFKGFKLTNITTGNLSNLPANVTLFGPFSLKTSVLPLNSTGGIVDYLLRAVTEVLYMGFDSLKDVPGKMLTANEGSLDVRMRKGPGTLDHIEDIELLVSQYGHAAKVLRPKGGAAGGDIDYVSLYQPAAPDIPALAIRFKGLKHLSLEMGADMKMDLTCDSPRTLALYNIHPSVLKAPGLGAYDFEAITVDKVPGSLSLTFNGNITPIRLDMSASSQIGEVRHLSRHYNERTAKQDYFELRILGVPGSFSFSEMRKGGNETIKITTSGAGLQEVRFVITNGPVYTLPDNFLCMRTSPTLAQLSGAFYGLGSMEYVQGPALTKLSATLLQNRPMRLKYESSGDRPSKNASTELYLSAIPSQVTLRIPTPSQAESVTAQIGASSPAKKSTVGAVADFIAGLGGMVSGLLTTGGNASEAVAQSVSAKEQRLDLEYSFASAIPLTLAGRFLMGAPPKAKDPYGGNFLHGAYVRQEEMPDGNVSTSGRVYLTGLPRSARVTLDMHGEYTNASMSLKGFRPVLDSIAVSLRGVKGVDCDVLLGNLTAAASSSPSASAPGLDLDMDARLRMSNTSDVYASGVLDLSSNMAGPEVLAKGLMNNSGAISEFELAMLGVPGRLREELEFGTDVLLHHNASGPMRLINLNATQRSRDGDIGLRASLANIPADMTLDIDGLVPEEGALGLPMDLGALPRFDIRSSNGSMAAYIRLTGDALGGDGCVQLLARNMTYLSSMIVGGDYEIDIGRMGLCIIYAESISGPGPLILDRLLIEMRGISSATVSLFFLGGLYPGVRLSGDGGTISYGGAYSLEAFGTKLSPMFALRRVSVLEGDMPLAYGAQALGGGSDLSPDAAGDQYLVLGIWPTLFLNLWWALVIAIAAVTAAGVVRGRRKQGGPEGQTGHRGQGPVGGKKRQPARPNPRRQR